MGGDVGIFIVEKILRERKDARTGEPQYLIKWKDYPVFYNTWEPSKNILDPALIQDFKKGNRKKRKKGRYEDEARNPEGVLDYPEPVVVKDEVDLGEEDMDLHNIPLLPSPSPGREEGEDERERPPPFPSGVVPHAKEDEEEAEKTPLFVHDVSSFPTVIKKHEEDDLKYPLSIVPLATLMEGEEVPHPDDWDVKLHVLNLPRSCSESASEDADMVEEEMTSWLQDFGVVVDIRVLSDERRAYVFLKSHKGDPNLITQSRLRELKKAMNTPMVFMKSDPDSTPSDIAPIMGEGEDAVGPFKIRINDYNQAGYRQNEIRPRDIINLFEGYGIVLATEARVNGSLRYVWMRDEEVGKAAVKGLHGKRLPQLLTPLQVSKEIRDTTEPEILRRMITTVSLQVQGLPPSVTAYEVRSLFQAYGTVMRAKVWRTKGEASLELDPVSNIRSAIKDWNGVCLKAGGPGLRVKSCTSKASSSRPPEAWFGNKKSFTKRNKFGSVHHPYDNSHQGCDNNIHPQSPPGSNGRKLSLKEYYTSLQSKLESLPSISSDLSQRVQLHAQLQESTPQGD